MNNKIFLFGEMYKLVDKYNKDENGKDITLIKEKDKLIKLLTEADREEIYEKRTSYEINKNTFISENYSTPSSMAIIWNRYFANILESEKNREKDLAKFSSEEIVGLMASIITSSENTKVSIYGFIEKYVTLQYNKGEILSNPIDKINRDDVVKVNKKMIDKKMISIKEIDELCEKMYTLHLQKEDEIDPKSGEKKLKRGLNVYNFISIILARYGILGDGMSQLLGLKWEDINEEKMIVQVRDQDDNIKELPIDEIFLKWIKRAKLEDTQVNNKNSGIVDNGYVIKTSAGSKSQSEKPVRNTVYTNYKNSFLRIKEYPINFKDLKNSRIIELLLEIRRERKISTADILSVIEIFESDVNGGRWNTISILYFNLFNEKPIKMNSKVKANREMAFDEDSKAIASEFRIKAFGEDFYQPTPECIMRILLKR